MRDKRQTATLILDGWRFHSTYDSEASAREIAGNLLLSMPISAHVKVESFGINISTIDPMTGEAQVWHKVEGFSVWYQN